MLKQQIIELYPNHSSKYIAELLGVTISKVYNTAWGAKVKKSAEYMLTPASGRIIEPSVANQFKPGHTPHNKGKQMDAEIYEKVAPTMFKKGNKPHNTKPIGYRSTRDGYMVEKTENGFEFVHWLLWRQHYGEIPKGLFVVFKDRNRLNVCIDNLELIDRSEHMRRNHIQNLPAELRAVIHIKKQITRKINQHGTKQN